VLFIDLRDHYGITQVVADVDNPIQSVLDSLRTESVVTITGEVVARAPEAVNPKLPTGEIEVVAREVEVRSSAAERPTIRRKFASSTATSTFVASRFMRTSSCARR